MLRGDHVASSCLEDAQEDRGIVHRIACDEVSKLLRTVTKFLLEVSSCCSTKNPYDVLDLGLYPIMSKLRILKASIGYLSSIDGSSNGIETVEEPVTNGFCYLEIKFGYSFDSFSAKLSYLLHSSSYTRILTGIVRSVSSGSASLDSIEHISRKAFSSIDLVSGLIHHVGLEPVSMFAMVFRTEVLLHTSHTACTGVHMADSVSPFSKEILHLVSNKHVSNRKHGAVLLLYNDCSKLDHHLGKERILVLHSTEDGEVVYLHLHLDEFKHTSEFLIIKLVDGPVLSSIDFHTKDGKVNNPTQQSAGII